MPVFDLNDDGRLSKVPVANRAPWKKRDIRVLIRYQARRTIDVNSQNPDDEDKKIDERDLAERMGHLAVRNRIFYTMTTLGLADEALVTYSLVVPRLSLRRRTPSWA